MSEPTQGLDTANRLNLLCKAAFVAAAVALVQGCARGATGAAALDSTITTASVPSEEAVVEDERLLADGQAILGVLSGREQAGDTALWWENPESGARGMITAYAGAMRDGRECLDFTTTRENFEGIGLYRGTACEDAAGTLRLRDLAAQ